MANRIWVVSELYYPEETSTGHFLTRIAEGLATRFSVRVLCGQPGYSERGIRAPKREFHNGVVIRRCSATTADNNLLFFKMLNTITITISIFWSALQLFNRADLVFVVTNPPLLPFAIMLASRLRGANYAMIVHDVYPEVLVAAGMLRPGSTPVRLLNWLNVLLYRGAAQILSLGRDMRTQILQKLHGGSNRVTIVPNWADLDEIYPSSATHNKLLNTLGLNDKFVIQYSGNIGRTHGVECLLQAAEQLKDNKRIHFLFIVSGAKRQWLESFVQDKRLDNVTILPRRTRKELQDSLNACDLAVISLLPGMAGVSVPSRMYNILAAGKPILAVTEGHSEVSLVVQEEQVGWVVEPDRPDKISTAILEASKHPEVLTAMGKRARCAAERKYTLAHVIDAYTAITEEILKNSCQR